MPVLHYAICISRLVRWGWRIGWRDVCRVYAEVNTMFGDIVKVTPTSKAVGDMALFMVANGISASDVMETTGVSSPFRRL